jgi:Flp pilus assembly protein TadG
MTPAVFPPQLSVRGLRRLTRAFIGNEHGAALVEFAIVAPVMVLLLLGAFDVAHSLYMRAVLQGVVQKVSRDSSLEAGLATSQQVTLDNRVRAQAELLASNATVTITRKWYRSFTNAAAGQFEPFTDSNNNGTCDGPVGSTSGERYEDNNNNGRWDRTGGNDTQGGAKDAVVYTVVVSYPRFFPIYKIIGGSDTTSVSASTVLRNQPYGDQGAPTVRRCT